MESDETANDRRQSQSLPPASPIPPPMAMTSSPAHLPVLDVDVEAPSRQTRQDRVRKPRVKMYDERPKGQTTLPLPRIQRIMKAEHESAMTSKEALFVVAAATEEFVKRLALAGQTEAANEHHATVTLTDMANAVHVAKELNFLEEAIPRPLALEEALGRRKLKFNEDQPSNTASTSIVEHEKQENASEEAASSSVVASTSKPPPAKRARISKPTEKVVNGASSTASASTSQRTTSHKTKESSSRKKATTPLEPAEPSTSTSNPITPKPKPQNSLTNGHGHAHRSSSNSTIPPIHISPSHRRSSAVAKPPVPYPYPLPSDSWNALRSYYEPNGNGNAEDLEGVPDSPEPEPISERRTIYSVQREVADRGANGK